MIDIRLKTAQLKITYLILLALFAILLIYSLVESYKPNLIVFGLSFIFLAIYLFLLAKKFYYFYYNEDKYKIIIRYYHSHPYIRKYKSIEIPKENLVDFDITNSLFGLQKNLTLTVASKKGNIEYPTISISALNASEVQFLETALQKNIKKK